jgi:hypothetical protein
MIEWPNRVGGRIALPAPTPPSKRVRFKRSQTPSASVPTAPALRQGRRGGPA